MTRRPRWCHRCHPRRGRRSWRHRAPRRSVRSVASRGAAAPARSSSRPRPRGPSTEYPNYGGEVVCEARHVQRRARTAASSRRSRRPTRRRSCSSSASRTSRSWRRSRSRRSASTTPTTCSTTCADGSIIDAAQRHRPLQARQTGTAATGSSSRPTRATGASRRSAQPRVPLERPRPRQRFVELQSGTVDGIDNSGRTTSRHRGRPRPRAHTRARASTSSTSG